jgi:hypothetical protein
MKYFILALALTACGAGSTPPTGDRPVYDQDVSRTPNSDFVSYDLLPGHCEYIKEINTLICSPDFKEYDDE